MSNNRSIAVGIDLGTSTIKAVFIDTATCEIITTQTEDVHPVKTENPDWVEYDPMDWWKGTLRLLKKGYEAGVDPSRIAGVAFTGWICMALFSDENGVPVTNAVHYTDMRHMSVLDELETLVGKQCVEKNANYLGMYSGMVKQYWWKKNRPEVFAKARRVHTEASWMIKKLTGIDAWNRPEAGFYSLYDFKTRDWDDEIIDAIGFDRELFPKLYDAWEIVGGVSEEAAELTGLVVGTSVVAGADDGSPVALATGVIEIGQSFMSSASGANLVANTAEPVSHPTIITFTHCIPGLISSQTVMSSTGASNKWVRDALCQAETAVAEITGGETFDYMNQAVKNASPGSGGVIFLPYLSGEFTPHGDSDARGCFIGIGSGTTKADMLRAVLEGVAFAILDNIMLIRDVGGKLDEIIITGGLTKSDIWMQIIADVTGCALSLTEETEGSPFGGALLAGIGVGLFESYEDAVSKMVRINRNAYLPTPENTKLYANIFKVYQSLYPALKDVFTNLGTLRGQYFG